MGAGTLHRQHENLGRFSPKAGNRALKREMSLNHLAEDQPRITELFSELYF